MPHAGYRIARIFGIDITVDPTLLIAFALIAASLGLGLFPVWHPEWSLGAVWAAAIVTTICFFLSLVAHELSHSLVARANGLPVRRITLFIFGGVSSLEEEPHSPGVEFWMAIVGPLTSLAIGVAATILGAVIATEQTGGAVETMRDVGPVASVLLWLGPINVALGVFNLIPGFPLDGGRVFRSIVWKASHSLRRATRIATQTGRVIGFLFIALGVLMALGFHVPFFGRGLVSGLWIALIGSFLHRAASASWRETELRLALHDVPISRVMRPAIDAVHPELPMSSFVFDHVMRSEQRTFPVEKDGRLVGIASASDLNVVPRIEWPNTPVSRIMIPIERLPELSPQDRADLALQALLRARRRELPVVDEGIVRGVIRGDDLVELARIGPEPS